MSEVNRIVRAKNPDDADPVGHDILSSLCGT